MKTNWTIVSIKSESVKVPNLSSVLIEVKL